MAPVIALSTILLHLVRLITRCTLSMKIQLFEANFLYCALYIGVPYSLENTVYLHFSQANYTGGLLNVLQNKTYHTNVLLCVNVIESS